MHVYAQSPGIRMCDAYACMLILLYSCVMCLDRLMRTMCVSPLYSVCVFLRMWVLFVYAPLLLCSIMISVSGVRADSCVRRPCLFFFVVFLFFFVLFYLHVTYAFFSVFDVI